ncbi:hypothetical protein OV090_06820 [Nannocystis sp. RBIL2]|uniref:hypothetical protein n=1 Tax=Nannocystis sp. RBIL2 TaxID=2996788 RepID=UPI0022703D34|nr:hypothetical protein [Nannocystis sp. RBIL2]MCY1064465.1 hypothetical protein [Nannocystis sp. RBIL2]
MTPWMARNQLGAPLDVGAVGERGPVGVVLDDADGGAVREGSRVGGAIADCPAEPVDQQGAGTPNTGKAMELHERFGHVASGGGGHRPADDVRLGGEGDAGAPGPAAPPLRFAGGLDVAARGDQALGLAAVDGGHQAVQRRLEGVGGADEGAGHGGQ